MANKLNCPFCPIEEESSLSLLDSSNPEYYMSVKVNDGTKKWFYCSKCEGVYCRDKIKAAWQYSPGTYTKFVEKGLIADRLEN